MVLALGLGIIRGFGRVAFVCGAAAAGRLSAAAGARLLPGAATHSLARQITALRNSGRNFADGVGDPCKRQAALEKFPQRL